MEGGCPCDIEGIPLGSGPMPFIGLRRLLYIDFNAIILAPSGVSLNVVYRLIKVNKRVNLPFFHSQKGTLRLRALDCSTKKPPPSFPERGYDVQKNKKLLSFLYLLAN